MPQMSPLNWLSLFFLFFFCFILFNILNYFSFMNINKMKSIFKNKNSNNLNWKW